MNNKKEWTLVWADEFEGSTIDKNNWNFQEESADRFNKEWQRYTNSPENAYIENNQLVIKAIHLSDTHGLNQYTSARLNTAHKQAWQYGKISARIKLPEGEGIWPAFWMLGENIDENGGDTPWPQCGEIDILELYGSRCNATIEVNFHFDNPDGKHSQMGAYPFKLKKGNFSDDFHIFELEWSAEAFKWYVDGECIKITRLDQKIHKAFNQKSFLLLNIAVGGEEAGRPNTSTSFPQCMIVDWIRVYQ